MKCSFWVLLKYKEPTVNQNNKTKAVFRLQANLPDFYLFIYFKVHTVICNWSDRICMSGLHKHICLGSCTPTLCLSHCTWRKRRAEIRFELPERPHWHTPVQIWPDLITLEHSTTSKSGLDPFAKMIWSQVPSGCSDYQTSIWIQSRCTRNRIPSVSLNTALKNGRLGLYR